jgi:hypothetical protein
MHNDTFEFTTDKEVFEYISNHLLKQNEKSIEGDVCMYRAGNLKCAVGAVIGQIYYHEELEGRMISSDNEIKEIVQRSIPKWKINTSMLAELQDIHDGYEPYGWQLALSRLSLNFVNNSFTIES